MKDTMKALETLRVLSVEQVHKAKSGHPGIALGAAPLIYTLYTKIMNVFPGDDRWVNRDRFVMAAGHGSALLYSILHLSGFGIMISDLKNFRQLGSITPGHPERGDTPGVDSTSGPLGQGIAIGTGMAIAEEYLRGRFNKEGLPLIDHYTYVLCGDGDLQEGVTQEAMSLAGHLRLSRLIVLYDSNDIQLDGPVKDTTGEDVAGKYRAMGWNHILVSDGENISEIEKAVIKAKASDRPTIIEIKTVIGVGSSLAGSHKSHGSPLPAEDVKKMRAALGGEHFEVSREVYDYFRRAVYERGREKYRDWEKIKTDYQKEFPEEFALFESIIKDEFTIDFEEIIPVSADDAKATREYGGAVIDAVGKIHAGLIGGSADLSSSTKIKGPDGSFGEGNRTGRNINFGVREHVMGAISNGLALHGLRPVCGTFFVFSDYMKPAIRMSALMSLPVIYVFTHDSVAVGEDGPTHQPVEQLTMLRSVPNLTTFRPADGYETKLAFRYAFENKNAPTAIVLTRQAVPNVAPGVAFSSFGKGGYVLAYEEKTIDGILMASGSEVQLALRAKRELLARGFDVRVASIPSLDLFARQEREYQNSVLPENATARVAIEMGEGAHWHKFIGPSGILINIDRFGASAPGKQLIESYGFTVNHIVEAFIRAVNKKS
ncbi:MAG TPA: transketolase [Bacilli bacterium]|jgi:transketolase|nr:transketolase [Bacilli bacterium]HPZ26646.1 transketolase [Bacilli bacterium]HQC88948.1 transketolase [Bacilli bacterium]